MRKFALDIDAHQIAGAGEESYEVRSRKPLRLPLLGDAERNCDADSDGWAARSDMGRGAALRWYSTSSTVW